MAAVMTYSTLFSDVQAYLERGQSNVTDPTVFQQIPRLINLGERNCMNTLKLQGVIEVMANPSGLTLAKPVLTKPDRWRSTVSISYGAPTPAGTPWSPDFSPDFGGQPPALVNRRFLFPRSYEYCRSYWPNDTMIDPQNPPFYYADYDLNHWLIAPTPDQTYPLEIICYMQPVYLDAVNQTNFFTNYAPNMLLYATLLEAAPFLKGDERIQVWQALFDRQAQLLQDTDLQKIMDRAEQRRKA